MSYTRWGANAPCEDFIGKVAPSLYFNKDTNGIYLDEYGKPLYDGCSYRDVATGKWYLLYENQWYEQ